MNEMPRKQRWLRSKETNNRATFQTQFTVWPDKKKTNNYEILVLLWLFSLGEVEHQRNNNLSSTRVAPNNSTQIKKLTHFLSFTSKERKEQNETLGFSTETNINRNRARKKKKENHTSSKAKQRGKRPPSDHPWYRLQVLTSQQNEEHRTRRSFKQQIVRVLYSAKRMRVKA